MSAPGPRPVAKTLPALIGATGLGLALGTLMLAFVARPMRVDGESMVPGLRPNDVLLVAVLPGIGRLVDPGDLVVARPATSGLAGTIVVKRVLRVSGTGPALRFELVGDNSASSLDSRSYGLVPAADLVGLVLGRLYPPPFSVASDGAPSGRATDSPDPGEGLLETEPAGL
jgi:signal peptidase I